MQESVHLLWRIRWSLQGQMRWINKWTSQHNAHPVILFCAKTLCYHDGKSTGKTVKPAYYKEHYELMIGEKALQKLKNL